jgi:hypothetical protein
MTKFKKFMTTAVAAAMALTAISVTLDSAFASQRQYSEGASAYSMGRSAGDT